MPQGNEREPNGSQRQPNGNQMEAKGSQMEALEPNGSQKAAKIRQGVPKGFENMLNHLKIMLNKRCETNLKLVEPKTGTEQMRKAINNHVFLNLFEKK